MIKPGMVFGLLMAYALLVFPACQRESPAEKAGVRSPRSTEAIEGAAQQTVDGIKGPMDKARMVEGTLEKAAERTAGQAQDATP